VCGWHLIYLYRDGDIFSVDFVMPTGYKNTVNPTHDEFDPFSWKLGIFADLPDHDLDIVKRRVTEKLAFFLWLRERREQMSNWLQAEKMVNRRWRMWTGRLIG
jgi:hypothetical protein